MKNNNTRGCLQEFSGGRLLGGFGEELKEERGPALNPRGLYLLVLLFFLVLFLDLGLGPCAGLLPKSEADLYISDIALSLVGILGRFSIILQFELG